MLVLSRRENDAIVIGEDIHIVVRKIQGSRVRLVINAPQSTKIKWKGESGDDVYASVDNNETTSAN